MMRYFLYAISIYGSYLNTCGTRRRAWWSMVLWAIGNTAGAIDAAWRKDWPLTVYFAGNLLLTVRGMIRWI